MSAPEAKPAPAAPKREYYEELAERIFIGVAAHVYGSPAAGAQKPDPKAVAAMCFISARLGHLSTVASG